MSPQRTVLLVTLIVFVALGAGSSIAAQAWPGDTSGLANEEQASTLEQMGTMAVSQPVTETLDAGVNVVQRPYSLVVHGADQNFIPADSPMRAVDGQKWVVVLAGVNNFQRMPVTITHESLVLIDQAGIRYLPDLPDEQTQPALVGKVVAAGQRVLGLVRFQVPPEVTGEWLEWCPAAPTADCADPARSPIPLTPTVNG